MPRKRKKPSADFPAAEPTPIASPLAELAEKHGLITADQLPIPTADLPPPQEEKVWTRPMEPRKRDIHKPSENDIRSHQRLRGVPPGYVNVHCCPDTGIRLNKSIDRQWVAIQFPDEAPPTPEEKRLLYAFDIADEDDRKRMAMHFDDRESQKQWKRRWEGNDLGINTIKAENTFHAICNGRKEGLGR